MTESEVLEAIQDYAKQSGFEMTSAEGNVIPMRSLVSSKLELVLKYELTGGGGCWITFKLLLGEIRDPRACVGLLFIGRYPGTSFYFVGDRVEKHHYLLGETFLHLRNEMTPKQATDEMCLVADIGSVCHLGGQVAWPSGVELYLSG
jgi:hypothetical protein